MAGFVPSPAGLMDELLRIPILGAAEMWLDKEPPNSITSWDDLVSKFLNQFYPHSKTRAVRREIVDFQQVFCETFTEAWERFNDLLRECPHHGFSLLHQINFFYSGLSQSDQDFLNTAAGGNLMNKNTQEALIIIERKARVRTCRNKYVQEEQGVQKKQEEQAAQSFTLCWNFPMINDDDDEYTIQYREYLENSSNAITPDLPTEEPDNSLSMGDEHLSTIPEMESDKLIESNLMESLINQETSIVYSLKIDSLLEEFAGKLAPILPGIHEADFDPKEYIHLDDQMFYDDTSSDDDSFEDIDYVEASPPDSELVSIEELNDNPTPSSLSHSDNSLPEFETFGNDTKETRSGSTTTYAENSLPEYDSFHFEIESDQGELSRAVMETIDEIDAFLDIDVSTDLEDGYHDSEGDIIYLESLLINNTIPNFSPEVFFDHEQKCLKDEPNNLISMVKVFNLGIPEKNFSPTYMRLSFEDRHYLSFTYVIRIFLSYFTYPVEFPFPFSFGSEDTIFDPGIFAYSFYSLEPVACKNLMTIFPSICFCPKDKGIRGESS
ncbi:reverse transcriptase domain-containing protein [Tanacetum coccineum]|uniref:Reverse transcriptase domain-containing protein n=1 Tax=Tanacetum coccineum TaxID=301880 RepID=A0ABQ5C4D8_9ASTR